jgi:Ca2+-binding EF-hand superfamily protein
VLILIKSENESEEEISRAYKLFEDADVGAITFDSLKRISEEIEENVTDEELQAMLKEASKGSKIDHVNDTQFREVLNRATNIG